MNNLHRVAVRIGNIEVRVSDLAFADIVRHLHVLGSEVVAQGFGRIREKRNVIQATVLLRRLGEQLQVLIFVDLDKRYPVSPIFTLQRIRLFVSEKLLIERSRFLQIADKQRHMGNAENARPFHGVSGSGSASDAYKKKKGC